MIDRDQNPHEFGRVLSLSDSIFGVAMTAVNIAWNLGPMQFAQSEQESANYMAVHVTLTGLRGMLAPLLTLGTIRLLGLRGGFAVSSLLFLGASLLMLRLSRRIKREAR